MWQFQPFPELPALKYQKKKQKKKKEREREREEEERKERNEKKEIHGEVGGIQLLEKRECV